MSSSSSTSVLSNLIDSHPTSLTTIHHLITIKLTHENCLLWKAQVVPYLRGHLFKFVDGSHLNPPPVITTQSSGATTILVNPEFTQWQLQDQIVLSALISSLSKKVIAHVVRCTTSRELWTTLEPMFIAQSQARLMQIHYHLSTLRKAGSPIANYFHTFTGLANTLAAIDQPLPEFQLVSFLLTSLGLEYDTFSPLSNKDLSLLLLITFMVIFLIMKFALNRINLLLISRLPLQILLPVALFSWGTRRTLLILQLPWSWFS
jgi:hypothetical protein